MPQVFKVGSYWVYFWLDENIPLEPIHVHVCQGTPSANATKIWITKSRRLHSCDRIPEQDLKRIYKSIQYNFFYIIEKWKERFGNDNIKFYC